MKRIVGRLQLFRDQIRRKVGMLLFDRLVSKPELKDVKNILVIRWDAKLGDSYISSFFFREIKKIPNAHITVVTTPDLEGLYSQGFGADSVLAINKRPNYKELKKAANKIGSVDLVVHLTEHMKMKDLYFLSLIDAKNVASMDDKVGRVNIKMSAQTSNMLFHDKYVHLLKLLSVPNIDDSYIIPYDASIGANKADYDLICNFFGSTEHKSVSLQRAIITLNKITKSYPDLVVGILSSPATADKAKEIAKTTNGFNVKFIESIYTINDAINTIANAQTILTVDTSIVHIAVGLKKKVIAIYPKTKNSFNTWLPPTSATTSILLSPCDGIDVDVNNYADDGLIKLLSSKVGNS